MADTSERLGINEDHKVSRSPLTKLRILLTRPVLRLTRGMTLGSRTAVIDGEGRFMLVKQTYAPGWIFPGGGGGARRDLRGGGAARGGGGGLHHADGALYNSSGFIRMSGKCVAIIWRFMCCGPSNKSHLWPIWKLPMRDFSTLRICRSA